MRKTRLTRKASLPRTAPLPRSGIKGRRAPLKASGETKRKKRARYAAYLKSPEWKAKRKACLEAAGYRCTCWIEVPDVPGYRTFERCPRKATQAHHRTYARFGHELPEDLRACCKPHHDAIEAEQFPHRRRSA